MTAPQISPMVVDQTRLGGAGSSQRHGFNILPGPRWKTEPKAPGQPVMAVPRSEIAPPPSRLGDLGYGLMEAPELTQAQIKAIQTAATPLIEAIRTELESLKLESRVLSPESLRENPDIYQALNELGPYFTPQEMRNQVVIDTKALQAEASRILTGAISSYLTEPQTTTLVTVDNDAKQLVAYVQQFDLAPVTGAKSKLSDDEVKQRLSEIRASVQDAEKIIVAQEATSVPVAEQSSNVLGTVLVVGVLAAIGWYLVDQL